MEYATSVMETKQKNDHKKYRGLPEVINEE